MSAALILWVFFLSPFICLLCRISGFFPITSSGLTDPPAHHHELPPPALVRQQLCGQPPQWLHDGSAEANASRFIHFFSRLPGHREAAAPEQPESDPELGVSLRPNFGPDRRLDSWLRELPQLLLQRGEECSDGPECCSRCTCQISSNSR